MEFLTQNGIRLAYSLQAVTGNGSQTTYSQSGTGERLTVNHLVRQSKLYTACTYFVLEQLAQRLHQFKLQILGQTAYVVMRLHHLGCFCTTLYNVGIDGTLSKEVDAVQLTGFFLKDADKLSADNLALLFRVGHVFKLGEETVCGIHVYQVSLQLLAKDFHHGFRFALTHQSVVHVYANQLVSDGFQQQSGHHGAIHTTGQCQQHLTVAYLTAYQFYLVVDEIRHVPISLSLTSIEYERFHSILDGFHIIRKLRQLHFTQRLVVSGGHHGEPCFVNLGQYIDRYPINHIIGTTVDDDTFHIRQSLQFGSGNIVRVYFAIYSQRTNRSGKHCVLMASQIQNHNHILLHSSILFLS